MNFCVLSAAAASSDSAAAAAVDLSHSKGSSSSAALPVSPFADLQNAMHRSYRLDVVQQKMTRGGIILAKQENEETFSFVGFEGLPYLAVATRLMLLPEEHRTFHVVCSTGGPCDFYGDIDLPATTSDKIVTELLDAAVNEVTTLMSSACERMQQRAAKQQQIAAFAGPEVLLLRNPNPAKKSLHLHMSFPHLCFEDYVGVRAVAEHINAKVSLALFDLHCYRSKGMLRLPFNGKSRRQNDAHEARHSLEPVLSFPPSAEGNRLRSATASSAALSRPQIVSKAFCLREEYALTKPSLWKELKGAAHAVPRGTLFPNVASRGSSRPAEFDEAGRKIPAFLAEATKPRRYQEVVKSVRSMPTRCADHYDQWIRVGLALHNFGSEDKYFEEWVTFSLRCPNKFSRESCRKMWNKFVRHPDHTNWRRGYNYLTKTIYREMGVTRSTS